MMARFSAMIQWIFSLLVSPGVVMSLDVIALGLAAITVAVVYSKLLFADACTSRVMISDPRFRKRIVTICVIEVVLHALKVPALMKVAASIFVIIIALIILLAEATH